MLRLLVYERSTALLVRSCAVGVYIAFCPFMFFHTVIAVIIAWCFRLNFPVIFLVSNVLNNPWSLVPIYLGGYLVGDWCVGCTGVDPHFLNPAWLAPLEAYVSGFLGIDGISLVSFLIRELSKNL